MSAAESLSHRVYVGADVVVKIIDADGHSRLNREIALVPHLPSGLTARLLRSGIYPLGKRDVRYACYTRAPGRVPGMGMPGMDGATARLLAEQAVRQLGRLHSWVPSRQANQALEEPLDHGGFVSQAALFAEIRNLEAADGNGLVPIRLLDGLMTLAADGPLPSPVTVPVHADCHWGNWLASGRTVTALLDFEWARFGEPADDWVFLARFAGPHTDTVLEVIARATETPQETLRAQCEIREAAYLASDLRAALERSGASRRMATERLRGLEQLITDRYWWRSSR